jgi:uncharacterized membrane protein YfcA
VSDAERRAPIPPWVPVLWIGVAFLCSLCGIGGGLFAVPLLHYGAKLPLRVAVGSSLFLVLALALSATATEALRSESTLLPWVAALLAAGAVPGSQLGYRVARKIDAPRLKALFAAVLLVVGVRVFTAAEPAAAAGGSLSAGELAWIPLIGVAGGFLTPLFGIGGGILTVPVLFLCFDEIGYVEARSSSLAMSAVAAAWSARSYVRSREVDLRGILPLSIATVVGAVAGTRAVHLEGWAELARVLLGALLLLLSVRFALDVVRRARAGVGAE